MTSQPIYSTLSGNQELLDRLTFQFPKHISSSILLINITQQRLYHIQNNRLVNHYIVSSALNGTGSESGSGKTPLGAHSIKEKFGSEASVASIFKGRVNTGTKAKILSAKNTLSDADNITSRILWLDGLEPGLNRGGNVDSHDRYIYIHGTDEEGRLGQAVSHGCIRMANQDVIDLFAQVESGTFVYIIEE